MKRGKHDKFMEMLPLCTGAGGWIHGFVCKDWEIGMDPRFDIHYKACCQDPRNWEGFGEFEPLRHCDFARYDPYYDGLGFRFVRDMRCKVCGYRQCANEYFTAEAAERAMVEVTA